MSSRTNGGNYQVAGFAIATAGWILSITCMGLVEWRVWHMNSTSLSEPSLVCVGMWKVCVYRHVTYFDRATLCYPYTYGDTFLPVAIRAGQHLLLATSILGLLGKIFSVFALRKLSMGILGRKVICNPFAVSGILNMAGGICILVTVIWNHKSVMNGEGISFPPSFHIPLQPEQQEMGNAMLVAYLAAFLMLLSVLFLRPFKCPAPNQVQPEASKCKMPGGIGFANPTLPGSILKMLSDRFPGTEDHGKGGLGQKATNCFLWLPSVSEFVHQFVV